MNRRTAISGAAALAASAAIPVSLARVTMPAPMATPEAAEFAARVMAMPAETKALFAALTRASANGNGLSHRLADLVEDLAVQDGWVRGEQHHELLSLVVADKADGTS